MWGKKCHNHDFGPVFRPPFFDSLNTPQKHRYQFQKPTDPKNATNRLVTERLVTEYQALLGCN
jgi:hypothetical protein